MTEAFGIRAVLVMAIARLFTIIPQDKQLHFLWCFFFALALASVWDINIAAALVMGVGIVWELLSWEANTLAEHALDVLADAAGVFLAGLALLVLS